MESSVSHECVCVRKEQRELFYKRKNKNPKKPKPQTRDSPQKQKAPPKKKSIRNNISRLTRTKASTHPLPHPP